MPSASASAVQSPPHTPEGVELVAVTVAVAGWDVRTSALVDLTWSVAYTAGVVAAYAVVDVVADAIGIRVGRAVTTTHAQGVELVAVTVAVAGWDVRTSALVDLTWSVAYTASIVAAYAVVDVVTDAIGIRVSCAVTTTHAQGVELVAVTVAVAGWDVRTSALVDLTWSVAYTARVVAAYAVVDVVADAIGVRVSCAVTATHAQGVELVAVTVAVAGWDVRTSALVDLTWSVAYTASIVAAYAVVDVVTDAIGIRVGCAVTTTHAQGVELVAVTVAVAGWDVRTSALVDLTWSVAYTASVVAAYAVVDVVADAIGIGVGCAVTATHAQGVELVAVTVAVAGWDVTHPHS